LKVYETRQIRNLGVVGHAGAGKTSFVEALLSSSGTISRQGTINEGNTTSDFDPLEIKRKGSIHSAFAPIEHHDHKINLIDSPGYADFIGEIISTLRVVESVIFLFDGEIGVGVGGDQIWKMVNDHNIPRLAFINKLDKDRANFDSTLADLQKRYGNKLTAFQIPIGSGAALKGVIDILSGKAFEFVGGKAKEIEIPAELKDKAGAAKQSLMEILAETDEVLLNKFLESGTLSAEEINRALAENIISGEIIPVFCGSAEKNIGISPILDILVNSFPSPDFFEIEAFDAHDKAIKIKVDSGGPLAGYVFKTSAETQLGEMSYIKLYRGKIKSSSSAYNAGKRATERIGQISTLLGKNRIDLGEANAGDIVALVKLKNTTVTDSLCDEKNIIYFNPPVYPEPIYALAVYPSTKSDQEKMGLGLSSFSKEDPTFKVEHNPETHETVISGMGDIQLDLILERLKERFKVDINKGAPKIPYKETVRKGSKAQGKYKKQSGGRGQYGDCWLEIIPAGRGTGFSFESKIVGGAIPKNYIPSIEKGIVNTMKTGVVAGYPVIDIKTAVYDGSYHEVDSSNMAFEIAGSMGFKNAVKEAGPVILEPVMHVEIFVPKEYVGDITSDLNRKRGRILGMEPGPKEDKVIANVPYSELLKYATELRSITRGQGFFTAKFSHYEEAPAKTQQDLMAAYEKAKAEGMGARTA
jgi:elongation factor G